MLMRVLTNWFRIISGQPGRRFRDLYRYRQMRRGYGLTFAKVITILCGLLLIGVGVIMIPAPGPGSGIIALGLALLGSEFEPLAYALDGLELKVRPIVMPIKKMWDRMAPMTRLRLSLASALLGVAMTYGAYVLFF
jgi:hypothetical protein